MFRYPFILAAFAGVAAAQPFAITIDTAQSSAMLDAAVVLDTDGTLIGDFDPDTNPGGTQTRPGFFGGSGNSPVDTSADLAITTDLDTQPAGGFTLTLDTDLIDGAGLAEIERLSLDLLNGGAGATALSVTFSFDTFRTFDPFFLYPGGVPITIPLGEVGSVSFATLTQSGPGGGTIAETAEPGVFDLTAVVPVEIGVEISFGLPGGDPITTPATLPGVLPVVGTVTVVGDVAEVVLSASPEPVSADFPIDGFALPEVPLELPTLGSETAGVIFTLSLGGATIDAGVGVTLVGTGEAAQDCVADFNGDGLVDFFDIQGFLGAFGLMDPAADLAPPMGEFDFFDVQAFLNAFAAGCP